MDIQRIIDVLSRNRKPLSAACMIVGITIIATMGVSTVAMMLTLTGLLGLFWDNIAKGEGK